MEFDQQITALAEKAARKWLVPMQPEKPEWAQRNILRLTGIIESAIRESGQIARDEAQRLKDRYGYGAIVRERRALLDFAEKLDGKETT